MFRTMRACGISMFELNVALLAELVLFALSAGLIGMLCGYGIAATLLPDVAASLRGLYSAEIPGQLTLQPSWWAAGLAMSLAGTLAAAANALIKLQRLSILGSGQPEAWKQLQQKWLRRQGVLAVLVFAGAVAFLLLGDSLGAGFGLLGTLLFSAALALPVVLSVLLWLGERWAGRSVPDRPMVKWFWADGHQQLSGLSLALMALLLAMAVNVGVGTMVGSFRETFVSWLDGRLAADLYLDAQNDARAADIKAWLQKRPEPIAILPGARAETTLKGEPVELFGLANDAEYRARWPLLDAASDAWSSIQSGNAAFISEQLSRRSKLKLNDIVHVSSDAGDWPLRIVGVYADYGNPKGQLAVDFDALVKQFPQTPRTRIALRVAPEYVPALVEALKAEFKLGDGQIADQSAVKAESKRIFDRTFAVTAALNSFTLGVAAIALLTGLLTLGNSRLSQLAPLWAMGITLPRLAIGELLKMFALALLTALLAIPLGLAVGWCLIAVVNVQAFGWRLPLHVFPLQLLKLLAVSMLAALLATIVPILKLARMPPARLIKIFAGER
jgi:putative ABC transport system permease protein